MFPIVYPFAVPLFTLLSDKFLYSVILNKFSNLYTIKKNNKNKEVKNDSKYI